MQMPENEPSDMDNNYIAVLLFVLLDTVEVNIQYMAYLELVQYPSV